MLGSTRSYLWLWLFWAGLTSLTFVVNSFMGRLLGPLVPQYIMTFDGIIRAIPWALRSLLTPGPREGDGALAARVFTAGIVWFGLPRVLSALWPSFILIPANGPGEGQWWWLAGGLSLAISNRSVISGMVGAAALLGYLFLGPYLQHLPEALHIPGGPSAGLLWNNLLFGTLVGTTVFLSEVVSATTRGMMERASKTSAQG